MTDIAGSSPSFLNGNSTSVANQNAFVKGSNIASADQSVFVTGGTLSQSSKTSYLEGTRISWSHQTAFLKAQTLAELYTSRVQTDNGFDLFFQIPTFPDHSSIVIATNCPLTESQTTSSLHIQRSGTDLIYSLYDAANPIETFTYPLYTSIEYRVLYHGGFVTIYVGNYWIHTFYPEIIYYPETPTVTLKGISYGGNFPVLSNVIRKDLSDWRAAIWIDMETSSQNAINSIIQQRPIEIFPSSNGVINFIYERETRPTVDLDFVRSVQQSSAESNQLASDAIVYYSDVQVKIDLDAAREHGFITRMFRFPELDSGGLRAAKVALHRARQNAHRVIVLSRINLALEIGDIAVIDIESVTGTEIPLYLEIIVESISFDVQDGSYTMRIEGRENE